MGFVTGYFPSNLDSYSRRLRLGLLLVVQEPLSFFKWTRG